MKIAFDARSLFGGGTGDRTYFCELILALARSHPRDEMLLYERDADEERALFASQIPNASLTRVPFGVGALWNQLAMTPRLVRDGAQLLHSQYLLPPLLPVPGVVTIHDITFRLFPQWFPPRARRIMDVLIPLSARRASVVITGSQCAREDMIRHFKMEPAKIVVTPYAASPRFTPVAAGEREPVLARHGLGCKYLLGLGLRGERKNVPVVLRAMEMLQVQGEWPPETMLALAGQEAHFPGVESSRMRDKIRFLGYVPDEDLPSLYSGALSVVYPSFYEGFGLPPLEAMACGAPVLCSDRASLPEVVGQAGLLLSPDDVESWAGAIARVLHEPALREALREQGLLQSAQFSWQRCAEETAQVYEKLLR